MTSMVKPTLGNLLRGSLPRFSYPTAPDDGVWLRKSAFSFFFFEIHKRKIRPQKSTFGRPELSVQLLTWALTYLRWKVWLRRFSWCAKLENWPNIGEVMAKKRFFRKNASSELKWPPPPQFWAWDDHNRRNTTSMLKQMLGDLLRGIPPRFSYQEAP